MEKLTDQPIEQLVRRFHQNELSRGRFVGLLAALGVTGTGIDMLTSPANVHASSLPALTAASKQDAATQHAHKKLHHIHVQRQGKATHGAPLTAGNVSAERMQHLQAIVDDYADDAVVDDPMFEEPIVGKEAIAQRKMAELNSVGGASIDVVHRFAHRDQVVAEWVMRGTHQGDFLGFAATGRQIEVRGLTIVTRKNGKIARESLYYDVAAVQRQLGTITTGAESSVASVEA